ncbi:hypothetical protein M2102_001478 [Fusobacterium sp. PH5-7]|uniref:hypothetical protein n=1 Tax=Fusobacterium sp. PH5-7 TaxID=2940528 RepID=UPI00247593B3|nr:hypothetical protein [Fusobacterium sp. PH5-7]MDH6457849.1 hypothetical protein [Fusobacterium sp. PH5-7]
MALTDLVEGFLKDRKYTGPMPEIHIGEKSFAVDSSKGYGTEDSKNGKEIIFISQDSLNSPDVLQKLGHELGHLVKYDKDEKTAENIGSKIEDIKPEEEKDYSEYLASIKDKYKDLPSLEESKELESKILDEDKEKLVGTIIDFVFSPQTAGAPDIVEANNLENKNGQLYYNGNKVIVLDEMKDGKVVVTPIPKDFIVEQIEGAVVGEAAGAILKIGGKYVLSTPAGKYVVSKSGKIIGRLKPGTKEFEFINEVVSPNSSGTFNKTKIKNAGQEIIINSLEDKKLVQKIIKEGDRSGELTEELVNKLAKEKKYALIEGGKYGSNNGIDHILVSKDGSSLIILDSKQMSKDGTFSILKKGADGKNQLSPEWIEAVARKIKNTETKKLLLEKLKNNKINTGIIGVDKTNGKVILLPVEVISD